MLMLVSRRWWWVTGALAFGCAGTDPAGKAPVPRQLAGAKPVASAAPEAGAEKAGPPAAPAGPSRASSPSAGTGERTLAQFSAFLKEQPELEYPALAERLGLTSAKESALSFDPTAIRYFDAISRELKLNTREVQIFRERGVVSIDHRQRYSMASAYWAIYTRDLPLLVTTDSILHALHRSFDRALMELETDVFTYVIDGTLARASERLSLLVQSGNAKDLGASVEDVDLYFTVARNLLAGSGAAGSDPPPIDPRTGGLMAAPPPAAVLVKPKVADPQLVTQLLQKISSLSLETPAQPPCTRLYGGERCVDWSQFKPRGHYTKSSELRRFFRTMMWLGRADLAFSLRAVDPASRIVPGGDRERRDALLAVLLLKESGELGRLSAVSRIIDFMVGTSDNVSVDDVSHALAKAGIAAPSALVDPGALERFDEALDQVGARAQQIRSQVIASDDGSTKPTALPLAFQLFGQRFLIDSFALSQLVYDSIVYQGEKQRRFMPSGLDVMAALGNDTAVRLLEPELARHHYSANLLALRRTVDAMQADDWNASAYNQWLQALRTLDDRPPPKALFPEVMQREAWRRKQLRTTLASWAELRHDTILYAKQSYTAFALCEYPAAFVEPYPEFFRRLHELASSLSQRIAGAQMPSLDPARAANALRLRDDQSAFFARFADTMRRLEGLARKELAGKPFTLAEANWAKTAIDIRGGGGSGGPPTYTGWYPGLIYGGSPASHEPVVSDVHSDPNNGQVLQVAVGDVEFVVVAVNNGPDRAAYVGPTYSYYEFAGPIGNRMTDEEWRAKLARNDTPARPSFARLFEAPGEARTLDRPPPEALKKLHERRSAKPKGR
jgi:hypothetical protein